MIDGVLLYIIKIKIFFTEPLPKQCTEDVVVDEYVGKVAAAVVVGGIKVLIGVRGVGSTTTSFIVRRFLLWIIQYLQF